MLGTTPSGAVLACCSCSARGGSGVERGQTLPAKDGFGVHAIRFAAAMSQSRLWEADRCG